MNWTTVIFLNKESDLWKKEKKNRLRTFVNWYILWHIRSFVVSYSMVYRTEFTN